MKVILRRVAVLLLMMPVLGFSQQAGSERTDESQAAFIEANLLSIFYHEFGHAIIDLMEVPIYGQEEDAADVVSVMLIDRFFDERVAQDIAYDSAFGYINDPEQTDEVAWWDLHGPDEQRYYNHVCLFYGANPDQRLELASELGLPDERAESCAEEYDQANDSWGVLFDEMAEDQLPGKLVMQHNSNAAPSTASAVVMVTELLADEVRHINEQFQLPQDVSVVVEQCGEANAFYDPESVSISVCSEFVAHLETLFHNNVTE